MILSVVAKLKSNSQLQLKIVILIIVFYQIQESKFAATFESNCNIKNKKR